MDPSRGSGLQELITDPDKNGIFKVSDRMQQKFVIEQTDGTVTTRQEFDLSNLKLVRN